MHESSSSPPLPLNLSVWGREGRSTRCWSLHFSPGPNWYRWFFLYLKLQYFLSYCQYCFLLSGIFHISLFFLLFLIPFSLPCTSCVHCSRYQTFYERSPLRTWATFIPNQSVWSFKAVCSGLPVLDRSVCDCKYFPDDAARSSGLLVETDSSHDWNLTVLLQPKKKRQKWKKKTTRTHEETMFRKCYKHWISIVF